MKEYIPKHFYDTYFYPILNEALNSLEDDFQKNFIEYKEQFILNFNDICNNIKNTYSNFKVGYISYNLMLNKILNHNYKYDIYIYNKNWYLDGDIKVGEYDVSFIYKYFEKMWTKLLKERRGYVFKINDTDVNNLMFEIVDKFHCYVVSLMRNSIVELTETEEFLSINKESLFNIHTGKFYDKFDLIYTENKDKNLIKIKRWLLKNEKEEYCNEDFQNMELNQFNFERYDLRGADFRNSKLIEADLSYSILNGAKFKNCNLRNSYIISSFLSECNFENADLSGSKMTYSFTYKGKFGLNKSLDVGFLETNFKNTNLTNVDFRNSVLENIDFSTAIIKNTNFKECKFKECKFTIEQLEKLNLTEEQKKGIITI